MSDKKLTDSKKESAKDTMLKEMVDQLTLSLPALKEKIGDKKFEKRIKKAARLLTDGIKSTVPEPETKTKAAVPKKTVVKAQVKASAKKVAKAKIAAPAKKAAKASPAK